MVDVTVKQRVAEWLRVAKILYLDKTELAFLNHAEFYMMEDEVRDGLILGIETYVLTEKLATVREKVEVPATWWDMFKETYQHKWWMRIRKPIKHRTFHLLVDPMLFFPDYNRYPRDFGRPIRFFETKAWWEDVDS